MTLMPCSSVPHLKTANNQPLHLLEKTILDNHLTIEAWFRKKFLAFQSPITTSVDLRNANFKIAPVDTNLYPAGFNNLSKDSIPLCIQAIQSYIFEAHPNCTKILIIPESHTRNTFYLKSLYALQNILNLAGFDTRVGSLSDEITEPNFYDIEKDKELIIEPLSKSSNRLKVGDFDPCMVLLNNDLSSGIPECLIDIEQTILPDIELGWSNRLKTHHFSHYQKVADEFATLLNIDPWLLSPYFDVADDIDFKKSEGEEILCQKAKALLEKIQKKYDEYQVEHPPFVVIKANSGTYGMGVMMVKNEEELRSLNRKQRNKMAASKGKNPVNSVILQEGVYTFESWQPQQAVSEPVVYMLGHYVVGGFYRIHKDKKIDENLNAPGMHFEPLAFDNACNNPDKTLAPNDCPNRFYVYGVIARLANLAAAMENHALSKEK